MCASRDPIVPFEEFVLPVLQSAEILSDETLRFRMNLPLTFSKVTGQTIMTLATMGPLLAY